VGSGVSIPGWISVHVDDATPNGTHFINNIQANWTDNLTPHTHYGPVSASKEITAYSSPQLTITKEGPDEATVGSYITFTGSLSNVGGLPAANTVLVDYLPAGLTYVGSSQSAVYDPVARTVTWQIGPLGAGAVMLGWVTVQVDGSVPNGARLTNTFGVTWKDAGGNSFGPATADKQVIVHTNPLVSINKTGPVYGRPGGELTFNISLTNFGGLNAQDITLVDTLPDKYSYVSSTPAGTHSGGNISWNLGSLSPGANTTVSLTVLVDESTADRTPLSNGAMVTWKDPAGNTFGPNSKSLTTTIYSYPVITITKEGPPEAVIGSTYKFTGTLTNAGGGPAENVTLVDYLPTGLTFVGSSHSAVYDATAGTVTWQLDRMSSGSSIPGWISVHVDDTTPNGTHFINNFRATWEDDLGVSYGPVSAFKEITAYSSPQLTITKDGPDEATVGSYITFTGAVTNVGGLPAENVVLVDYLPVGLTFIGSSHSAVYDPSARTVTWQLGQVASGAAMPGWITVQVDNSLPNGSQLTNTFMVSWKDGDGNSFGPVSASKKVTARTNPLLSINKTGPAYGRPGSNLTFTISVANGGGLNAQNVTLTDTLPDKYSYVSSSPAGSHSGGNVIWNLGTLAPGTGASVSLTVQVDGSTANDTSLANGANVTWKDPQGNTFGPAGSLLTTTIYSIPHLVVTKSGPATANPGDNCTYSIEVRNVADHNAIDTAVFDIIPSRMSYVSSDPVGDNSTGPVIWPLVNIDADSTRTFSVTLHVDHELTQDTVLTDTAMATWHDEFGEDYGPATGSCSTSVTPFPELSVSLAGPSSGQVGTALTFTVGVTNESDTMAASNVVAQFMIPSGCSYNSSSDGGTNAGGTVTWNLGALSALGTRQVTVVITPSTAPPGSDVISTSAMAWQYPAGTSHGPKFANTTTFILPAPIPPTPPPTPELSPLDMMPVMPRSSGTVNSVPNPSPMQLPYIYLQSASLSTARVTPNSPVTVTAVFANKGTVNGSMAVKLYVNGYSEAAQGVALASGQSRTVSFDIVKAEPGQYQVYVNGTSAGSFTVEDTYSSDIVLTVSLACILAALVLGTIMIMRRRRAYY